MAEDVGAAPTIRRKQLGTRLRRLRDSAGKSQQEAADWLEVQKPSISKIENGRQRILLRHVRLLCQLYGVEAPELQALEELARQADERGWWTSYGDTVPDWFEAYLDLEGDAEEILNYESELVMGLLQTPGYVRAVVQASRPDATVEELQRFVDLRLARQQRLVDYAPPKLHLVLNEAVLLREVGGPTVMREQLEHLSTMAALPHVTLQVLPFKVGAHPSMISPFTMLKFAAEPAMNSVYLENGRGALYLERPSDLQQFKWTFAQLSEMALSPRESLKAVGKVS